MAEADLTIRVATSVGSLPAAQWDALAGPDNPFVSHAFLGALEESGSVGEGTGWTPAPLVVEDGAGQLTLARLIGGDSRDHRHIVAPGRASGRHPAAWRVPPGWGRNARSPYFRLAWRIRRRFLATCFSVSTFFLPSYGFAPSLNTKRTGVPTSLKRLRKKFSR